MLAELNSLSARTNDQYWTVGSNPFYGTIITYKPAERHSFWNLVDFLKVLKFTTELVQNPRANGLATANAQHIYTSLCDVSAKMQNSINKLNGFQQFILSALQWVFTGTTLLEATENLQRTMIERKQVDNSSAGKIAYPKLWLDAERALKDRNSYIEVSREYYGSLPSSVIASGSMAQSAFNKLLYHMRQAIVKEWQTLNGLIQAGKTIQHPDVMWHSDIAMSLSLMTSKLVLKHDLPNTYEQDERRSIEWSDLPRHKKEFNSYCSMQHGYAFWVLDTVGRLYVWIRSYPCIDQSKQSLYRAGHGDRENRPFMESFYQEGTRASYWRKCFNEICDLEVEMVGANGAFQQRHDEILTHYKDTRALLENPQSCQIFSSRMNCSLHELKLLTSEI